MISFQPVHVLHYYVQIPLCLLVIADINHTICAPCLLMGSLRSVGCQFLPQFVTCSSIICSILLSSSPSDMLFIIWSISYSPLFLRLEAGVVYSVRATSVLMSVSVTFCHCFHCPCPLRYGASSHCQSGAPGVVVLLLSMELSLGLQCLDAGVCTAAFFVKKESTVTAAFFSGFSIL